VERTWREGLASSPHRSRNAPAPEDIRPISIFYARQFALRLRHRARLVLYHAADLVIPYHTSLHAAVAAGVAAGDDPEDPGQNSHEHRASFVHPPLCIASVILHTKQTGGGGG
jgi:hypothetical protein